MKISKDMLTSEQKVQINNAKTACKSTCKVFATGYDVHTCPDICRDKKEHDTCCSIYAELLDDLQKNIINRAMTGKTTRTRQSNKTTKNSAVLAFIEKRVNDFMQKNKKHASGKEQLAINAELRKTISTLPDFAESSTNHPNNNLNNIFDVLEQLNLTIVKKA